MAEIKQKMKKELLELQILHDNKYNDGVKHDVVINTEYYGIKEL